MENHEKLWFLLNKWHISFKCFSYFRDTAHSKDDLEKTISNVKIANFYLEQAQSYASIIMDYEGDIHASIKLWEHDVKILKKWIKDKTDGLAEVHKKTLEETLRTITAALEWLEEYRPIDLEA